MKTLVDRYVYDVIRRLPEKSRPEVERELKANIADMLPESASQEDISRVLASLGDPMKLAEQYRAKPRYLISPAAFDDYLSILKLVIPIVAVVAVTFRLIDALTHAPVDGSYGQGFASIAASIFGSLFSAATNGFLWVTLGFGLAEYLGDVYKKKSWSPKDLPDIPPENAVKISRVESVISMVLSAAFLVMMTRYAHLIAWYESGAAQSSIPLFGSAALTQYAPYLTALTVCSWTVAIIKLYFGRWNYFIVAISALNGIVWTAATILFLRGADTFNPAFIEKAAQALTLDAATMAGHWQRGILVVSILSLIGTGIDIISGLVKARKGHGQGLHLS